MGGTGNVAGEAGFNFSMDVRQNFLTFGDQSWGTIKLGKDLGLFGSDVILSDMSLLGVGSGTAGNPLRNHNVTLGHIGTGYIYADWILQIAYISPSFGGAQFSLALMEAFGMGYEGLGVETNATPTPGVQAELTYDFAESLGRVWAGGMYQNTKVNEAPFASLDSYAGELGAKIKRGRSRSARLWLLRKGHRHHADRPRCHWPDPGWRHDRGADLLRLVCATDV